MKRDIPTNNRKNRHRLDGIRHIDFIHRPLIDSLIFDGFIPDRWDHGQPAIRWKPARTRVSWRSRTGI